MTVEADLHAEVEGRFRLDVAAPGADIGAAVGESLRGQCQVAIAKGGKQELAEGVRKLGRRRGHRRDGHKREGRAPHRESGKPGTDERWRLGPQDRKTDTENGIPGVRCLGPYDHPPSQ